MSSPEIVGVLFTALPLLVSALGNFQRTRKWHRVSKVLFLEVFDVPWNQEEKPEIRLTLRSSPAELVGLDQRLQTLSPPSPRCYRFFVSEGMPKLIEHVLMQATKTLSNDSTETSSEWGRSSSFAALRSQWRDHDNTLAWLSKSYSTIHTDSISFTARLLSLTKTIRAVQKSDDCVYGTFDLSRSSRGLPYPVFISNSAESTVPARIWEREPHNEPNVPQLAQEHVSKHLSDFCDNIRTSLSPGLTKVIPDSLSCFDISTKLMLLAFCHCSLDHMANFIDNVQQVHDAVREPTMNPHDGKPWPQSRIRDVINDAYFYERFRESVTDLTSATMPLLELLALNLPSDADLRYVAAETRAMCAGLDRSSTQLIARLESSMRLFELLRSVHESSNVRLLGLLAAIFLPLSLASSLLSMQTRLADLHYLLYDFCGVIVLLGTIVLVLVVLLRLYVSFKEALVEWQIRAAPIFTMAIPFMRNLVLGWVVLFWALLFGSFVVGMVQDVSLGLKILGYGGAGLGVLLLVLGVWTVLLWWLSQLN